MIDTARHRITLKIYALTDPQLIEALKRAAMRGCTVRVMLNAQRGDGSHDNDATAEMLAGAGVSVAWGPKHFLATHEKSLVIDEAAALISSFNYGERYFTDTRDYGIITRCPGQIREILACFDADLADIPFHPGTESTLLWAPGRARQQVACLLASAGSTIHLQHAKLVDATVLLRLMQALQRGVVVRILCAGGRGLHSWDRPETFASLCLLQEHGAKIRRLKTLKVHGNLTLVDDRTAQLGSLHFHHTAFDNRRELAIELQDKPIVKELSRRFMQDWDQGEHYNVPDPITHGDTDPVDAQIYQI